MIPQLRNSLVPVPDPRGHRYAAPDREDAFLCWLTVGRRSFAATSERTGIAENTLRSLVQSRRLGGPGPASTTRRRRSWGGLRSWRP